MDTKALIAKKTTYEAANPEVHARSEAAANELGRWLMARSADESLPDVERTACALRWNALSWLAGDRDAVRDANQRLARRALALEAQLGKERTRTKRKKAGF